MNGTNTSYECNWDPFIMIIIIGVRLLCVRMEILIKLFDEYWGRGVGAWGIFLNLKNWVVFGNFGLKFAIFVVFKILFDLISFSNLKLMIFRGLEA